MTLIVQKFGGTSVGSIDRIRNVARRVIDTKARGHDVVVVASAMAGETDRLIKLAGNVTTRPDKRELDQLVATGEQVSIALLAMAIQSVGVNARSFLASQVRIHTDSVFSGARILAIDATEVNQTLAAGSIAVIAGFQGVDKEGNVTTLGRGGSDTTAVALATALKASVCEIYTDVDGVYTADPNVVPGARKLERISHEEMMEMASLGAKVLHIRSVEFAMKYGIPIHVRSSFNLNQGSWIVKEEERMEHLVVTAVTSDKKETKISVVGMPDRPGVAFDIFSPLADANINVDMIIQNSSADGFIDISFTAPESNHDQAVEIVKSIVEKLGGIGVEQDRNIAKVSIVGVGMKTHAGVASKMFKILRDNGINIQMISTSEIKISVVLDRGMADLAVRALHDGFGLDAKEVSGALEED